MAPFGRWLAVALSGVAWAWCFGAAPRLVVPWLALVPFLVIAGRPGRGVGTVLLGWLHGTVVWLVAVSWIQPTIALFGGLPLVVSVLGLLGAALFLGSWHGLFALLYGRFLRHGPAVAMLGPAALWVVLEWARGHLPAMGFPWNLAAYTLADVPGALASSAWIGPYGLSFLVVFANAGIAYAWRARSWQPAVFALLTTLLILAFGARYAVAREADSGDRVEIVLIQPNSSLLATADDRGADLDRLLTLGRQACAAPRRPGTDLLVVWPESAAFPYTWDRSPGLRRAVLELAAGGCPVLLNTPLLAQAGVGVENAVLLVGPDGPAARYAKQRLVPFGEYVPFGNLLPFVGTLARIEEPFRPGRGVGVLPFARTRFGMTICYEVTFPELSVRQVKLGASFLVSITNDGWYGDSWAPRQHLRAARFRAAETHRPLLRAALTGISAVIDPRGALVDRIEVGVAGMLRASVTGATGRTLYVRSPWAVPLACLLAALGFGIIPGRRHPRRGPDEENADGPH